MMRVAILFGLIGLAIATGVMLYTGYAPIMQALAQAGWGIVWTSLYHFVNILFGAIGWQVLVPGKNRPSRGFFFYLLWIRSSVNNMMPVARIGGEIVAVRIMIKHGIRKTSAIASTVVELTMSVIAVFLFDIVGIGLFTWHVADKQTSLKLILGVLLSLPAIAAMIIVQRLGFFGLLSKLFNLMFRETWKKFAGNAAQLDRAVHTVYFRYDRVLICGFWQLMAWISGVGEIWLSLYFLGHQISLLESFMLEALIQAAASAAFVVPGALGVQEAGFVLFGHILGLSPEVSAAAALIRRCRDILIFVPGLVLWQIQEGRWLFKKTPMA